MASRDGTPAAYSIAYELVNGTTQWLYRQGITDLSAWEIVALGESRGVPVQGWLAILESRAIRKMREGEKPRFLGFALLLEIRRIHCRQFG
jgi:hypothetical protein